MFFALPSVGIPLRGTALKVVRRLCLRTRQVISPNDNKKGLVPDEVQPYSFIRGFDYSNPNFFFTRGIMLSPPSL
jgi:hypothetical protein